MDIPEVEQAEKAVLENRTSDLCLEVTGGYCGICGLRGKEHSTVSEDGLSGEPEWMCRVCFSPGTPFATACTWCGQVRLDDTADRIRAQRTTDGHICPEGENRIAMARSEEPRRRDAVIGLRKVFALFAGMMLLHFVEASELLVQFVPDEITASIINFFLFYGLILAAAIPEWRTLLPMMKLSSSRWNPLLPTVVLGASLTVTFALLQTHLFPDLPIIDYSDWFLDSGYGWATILLCVAVLPAVFEEIAFRGVIMTLLRKTMTPGSAIIVAAVLFAAIHVNVLGTVFYLIPVGLLTGWLTYRTGSLYPAMTVHFLHNAMVVWEEVKL